MKLIYNNMEWDKTDKAEVDLINRSIDISLSPIHALDAPYDAARKLIIEIEREAKDGIRYRCQIDKMKMIVDNFKDLADRIEKLEFIEDIT